MAAADVLYFNRPTDNYVFYMHQVLSPKDDQDDDLGLLLKTSGGSAQIDLSNDKIAISSTGLQLADGVMDASGLKVNGSNVIVQSGDASINDLDIAGNMAFDSGATIVLPSSTATTGSAGQIRFNSNNNVFEGYNGSAWGSLGGVIDIDRDTYVTAESSSDSDTLEFYTAGTERMRIASNGAITMKSAVTLKENVDVASGKTLTVPGTAVLASANISGGAVEGLSSLETTALEAGNVAISASKIGLTGDDDLMELSSDQVKVNGDLLLTGEIHGPSTLVIDPAAIGDNTGTVEILGNLTVKGTQTVINSTTLDVGDINVLLGKDITGASNANGGGLELSGNDFRKNIIYSSSNDRWEMNIGLAAAGQILASDGLKMGASKSLDMNNGSVSNANSISASSFTGDLTGDVTGTVSSLSNHDTDDVREGSTNLYFTDARARAAVSTTKVSGDGSVSYNSSTGVVSYTGPSASETRAHFSAGTGVGLVAGEISIGQSVATTANVSFNKVTANLTGNVTGTVSSLANHDTGSLTEGSNLYYTNARARGAVSVTDSGGDGSLSYDSATGVITYTGPSASETRAHFSAGTGVGLVAGEISIGQSVATNADVTFASVNADLVGDVTGDLTGDVTGTVSSLSNHSTANLAEGSNLYYTNARARAAVSVTDAGGDGSLAYNSGTGVLTYTGPSASETRAHFSAGTGVVLSSGQISIGQSVRTSDSVTFSSVSASFTGNLTGDVTGTVSSIANHSTTNLSEGNNKYFTDARARSAISHVDSGGDGSLSYNSTTGVITYTGPSSAEVRAHLSAGTGVSYSNGQFSIGQAVGTSADVTFNSVAANLTGNVTGNVTGTVSSIANHDTGSLSEGSNKYFTDARARAAVSVTDAGGDGSLSYNSSTGVITYTGPSASEVRAHLSAGTGVSYANGEFSIGQSVGVADDVSFGSIRLSATSFQANNAVTKSYVDSVVQGLDTKDSVRVATTANITLSGTQTIDGVALSVGDRVLVKDQSSASENGIYVVAAGSWSRSSDFDEPSELKGAFTYVEEGTVNEAAGFVQSGAGSIVVGTTDINFTQFSGAGSVTAGTGLSKSGNTLSVDAELSHVTKVGTLDGLSLSDDIDLDSHDLSTTGTVTASSLVGTLTGTASSIANHDTDSLSEGSSNLYFTQERARGSVSVTDAGGDGSLSYNSSTGVLTYTGPSASEVRAHLSAGTGVALSAGQISIGQSVGTSDDVTFNSVTANLTGNVTGQVSTLANHDTDNLSEGSSNRYFTEARARSSVSVSDAGGDGSLSYNSSTGVITYNGPSASEVRAHLSAGTGVSFAAGEFSIGQSVGTSDNVTFSKVTANLVGNVTGDVTGTVSSLANHDTDDVSEGSTNLYFSQARARSSVSVTKVSGDGSIAYNSGTGVVSYTGPSASETRAHFSAGTGVSYSNGIFSIAQSVATNADVEFASVTADLVGDVTGDLTGDVTGNVSGNAGTATKLQTARKLNGKLFDGSADVAVPTAKSHLGIVNSASTLGDSLTTSGDQWHKATGYSVNIDYLGSNSAVKLEFKANYVVSQEADQLISFKVTRSIDSGSESDVFQDLDLGTNMGVTSRGVYNGQFIDTALSASSGENVKYQLYFKVSKGLAGEEVELSSGILGGADHRNYCMAQLLYAA